MRYLKLQIIYVQPSVVDKQCLSTIVSVMLL